MSELITFNILFNLMKLIFLGLGILFIIKKFKN